MSNFHLNFTNAWLLLLLIPAILLTLLPYFRLSRKYRRTRNRITSIVLHLVIMVLSISVLAGITFAYDVPNLENEVLLLVDTSHSNKTSENEKNDFIKTILDQSKSKFKIGVVTFGYGQVYAAKLSNDTDKVYQSYLEAERPNDSATDFASAFNFARGLFESPQTAKIVLLTDGIETDGNVSSVIKSVAAEGIRVDTVFFSDNHDNEMELIDIITPNQNIVVGDPFLISVTVQSSTEGTANLTLYDNDTKGNQKTIEVKRGIQTFEVEHTFTLPGMHKIRFEIESTDNSDTLEENNQYYSYIYLEVFDKILILEREDKESEMLKTLLTDEDKYKVSVVNINETSKVPDSVDALRAYDQVILVNIARSDMPTGFESLLYSYVFDIGGGLFTVGGSKTNEDGEEVANTYSRTDMYGSLYQQMLPVEAIDYTPPVGVIFIIDRSGSMSTNDSATGKSYLDLAKEAATTGLNALTERDYCGIITLEDTYSVEMKLTPLPQMEQIVAAIDHIEIGGGTVFSPALARAGSVLKVEKRVERKHIILLTDGEPSDSLEEYGATIQKLHDESAITCSIFSIGGGGKTQDLDAAATAGGGHFYAVWDNTTLQTKIKEDLNVPEIKGVNYEPFKPTIKDHTSVVNGIEEKDLPQLEGFYGTKIKQGADVPLMAPYVPIYAQWKFGQGMVGSFMCDLSGVWSGAFLASPTGQRFIDNVINALFPTQNIRPQEIDAEFKEDNYTTQVNLYTDLADGETLELTITSPPVDANANPTVQNLKAETTDGYNRVVFTIMQPGIHEVLIQKKNAAGQVVAEVLKYKTFSYSAEYDVFLDDDECKFFLANLAEAGKGNVIELEHAGDIFNNSIVVLHRSYDPRLPFIIIAIVLFLLDVAVRKFKFKWPHEIIRDYKAKKMLK